MPDIVSMSAVNAFDLRAFVNAFGDVAESSPWVAEKAFEARPYSDFDALAIAFEKAIYSAPEDAQLALIKAHPDLAGKAARAGELAPASLREQQGAGLLSLSQAEYDRFLALNKSYRERFGYPFIMAVAGASKETILSTLEDRLDNSPAEEFQTTLEQIARIVRIRLRQRVITETL